MGVLVSGVLLGGAGAAVADSSARSGPGLFLADIKVVDGAVPSQLDLTAPLVLDLYAANLAQLRSQLDQTSVVVEGESNGKLRVRIAGADVFTQSPVEQHHAATWVVDYDQPSVTALSTLWQDTDDDSADVLALVAFTHAQIDDPNYRNGLLIASQVARRREGDCSEYGVLQTALARGAGYASRMIFGLLLMVVDNQLLAYGHAWSEIHDGGHWRVADATQPKNQKGVQAAYYLPVMVLENEGPGHVMELVKFATTRPDSVALVLADRVPDKPLEVSRHNGY